MLLGSGRIRTKKKKKKGKRKEKDGGAVKRRRSEDGSGSCSGDSSVGTGSRRPTAKRRGRGGRARHTTSAEALAFMAAVQEKVTAEAVVVVTQKVPAKIRQLSALVADSAFDAPNWAEYERAVRDFAASTGEMLSGTMGAVAPAPPTPALSRVGSRAGSPTRLLSPRVRPRGGFPSATTPLSAPTSPRAHFDVLFPGAEKTEKEGAGAAGAGAGGGAVLDDADALSSASSSSWSSTSSSVEFAGPILPLRGGGSDSGASAASASALGLHAGWAQPDVVKSLRVRLNTVIKPLADAVKAEFYDFLDLISILKNWIQHEVPSSPDRIKMFDVNVQLTILAEIMLYESTVLAQVRGTYRYYSHRGKLVSRVLKRPWNADLQNSVMQLDDQYFTNLSVSFSLLLNAYQSIHDQLHKNLAKIISDKHLEPSGTV